ncbi:hypothetical protein PR048_029113 [Dryococelus australis]|uniref:MADF domain-containing protein n=1 Tax=Dryococelus australis TaxID=614101 RepID=A0ABQ9GF05_9NEOP|nr:hypothetical protein PR048_029113 [Dryococelus australis]
MAKRAWSHDDIVKLSDMYEGRPMLWDCRSNGYKNRDHKNVALKEIEDVFNCTNEEELRKIHSLRNQVRIEYLMSVSQEPQKIRKKISGSAGGEEKSKCQYANAMKFVTPTMTAKSTTSNLVNK